MTHSEYSLEERELLFTPEQADVFFKSSVWLEVVATVEERIFRNSLEMENVEEIPKLKVIQGDSKACRFFLMQHQLIIEQLKEQAEAKQAERDEQKEAE